MKLPQRIVAAVAGSLLLLALVVLGGGYLYLNSKYNNVVDMLNTKQYDPAIETLSEIPSFFKDVADLNVYAEACAALGNGDFQNARKRFAGLSGFRDSDLMLLETDYQEAAVLLQNMEYEKASKAFVALGEYRDAKTQALAADYHAATALLREKEYEKAAVAFIALGGFQDAETQAAEAYYQLACVFLEQTSYSQACTYFEKINDLDYKDASELLDEAYYQIAVDHYHKKEYDLAEKFFYHAFGHKDSFSYLRLTQVHIDPYYLGDGGLSLLYQDLVKLGDFEDANSLKSSGIFYQVRFEGDWVTAGGGDYFSMHIGGLFSSINSSLPVPIDRSGYGWVTYSYQAPDSNGLVYIKTDGELRAAYKITMISDEKIEIYCYDNKKTYTMTKE